MLPSPAPVTDLEDQPDAPRQTLSPADALLLEAASEPDPERARELRRQAVVETMPLARSIAGRYLHRGETADDLLQVAYLALVKAVDRYEVGRAPCFDAYATPCIAGELRRWFRDRGWDVRPPRALQELRAAVVGAVEQLTQDNGRAPSPDEVAAHLRLPAARVREAYVAMQGYSAISLDAPAGGTDDGPDLADRLEVEDASEDDVVDRESLEPLLARLPDRDRHILSLRFYRGWTQEQIAQDVGVTQMQVSRVLKRVLGTLREQLLEAREEELRAS